MTAVREVRLENFDPELHTHLLRVWLRRPHVAPWWGNPQAALEDALRHSPDASAIILADEVPVGYLCWQRPGQDELEAAGLDNLPDHLVDIDILIGEPEDTGLGTGPRALGLLLARLQTDPGVSVAGVASSVSNRRAIRAFEKTGFRQLCEFQDPEFGLCRYLVTDVLSGDTR